MKPKKFLFEGALEGVRVSVMVTEGGLQEFLLAPPDAEVFYETDGGNQGTCSKGDVAYDGVRPLDYP